MEIATVNIEISTAPFPKKLIKIDNSIKNYISFDFEKYRKIKIRKPRNISEKIEKFSKYLGAIAVAKKVLKKNIPLSRFLVDKKYREIEKIVKKQFIVADDIENFAKQENIKLEKLLYFFLLDNVPKDSLTYMAIIFEKYTFDMSDHLKGILIECEKCNENAKNIYVILYGLMLGYKKLPYLGIDTKLNFDKKEDFQILENIYKKVFGKKITKKERLENLKKDIFTKNSLLELMDKFQVSERTLKSDIRQIIANLEISVSEKIEIFGKFSLRVPKEFRIAKLREIFETGKFTNLELSEKLKVSVNTVRNYLKEIK
jgi:hypothetical protein